MYFERLEGIPLLIDIVPIIVPEYSKDEVIELACDKMCSMCKYSICPSGICEFFNGDKMIPQKYLLGEKACHHFEQVFADNVSEAEKKQYLQLIAEWKKKNTGKDNRREVDG